MRCSPTKFHFKCVHTLRPTPPPSAKCFVYKHFKTYLLINVKIVHSNQRIDMCANMYSVQLSGAVKGSNKIYKDALLHTQTTDDKEITQITPETVDVVEIRNSQNG